MPQESNTNAPGYVRIAIILGLLCLVGPVAIDMYLPALPAISTDLGVPDSTVQLTLMVYFVAFGISQIFYGPAADMLGRRLPIMFGMTLFVIASIGCYFAPNIGTLIAFRAIQGLGAAAAMVIPRAIVRDLYTGTEATRLMAMVMLVVSIAPMLAPLMGSILIVPFGWRAVFLGVFLVGLLGLFLVWRVLPETHAVENRQPISPARTLGHFRHLLLDPAFMGLTLIGGFGMSSFFSFLSTSSFIYMEHYGLSPTMFSLAFAFNAVGFFAMSQMAAGFGERWGMVNVVRYAVTGFFGTTALLAVVTLMGFVNFFVLAGLLFLSFGFMGLIIPTAMVLALETNGPIAGSASALGGTLQMLMGAVAITILSPFFDGTTLPLVMAVASCGILSFLTAQLTLKLVLPVGGQLPAAPVVSAPAE